MDASECNQSTPPNSINKVATQDTPNDVIAVASISNIEMPFKFKINIHQPELPTADETMETSDDQLISKIFVECPLCTCAKLYAYKHKASFQRHMTRIHKHARSTFMNSTRKICRFCEQNFADYDDLIGHYYRCGALDAVKKSSHKKIIGMQPAKVATKKSGKAVKVVKGGKGVTATKDGKATKGRRTSRAAKGVKCCMCLSDSQFGEQRYLDHIMAVHDLDKARRFPREPRQCIHCDRYITSYKTLFQHCRDCSA